MESLIISLLKLPIRLPREKNKEKSTEFIGVMEGKFNPAIPTLLDIILTHQKGNCMVLI